MIRRVAWVGSRSRNRRVLAIGFVGMLVLTIPVFRFAVPRLAAAYGIVDGRPILDQPNGIVFLSVVVTSLLAWSAAVQLLVVGLVALHFALKDETD